MANDLYKADKALYSTTDPNGPDAGNGKVSTEARGANFQVCGDNALISADLVNRLGIADSGLVQPSSREEALEANDAKNRATYGENAAAGNVGRVADVAPAPEAPKPTVEAVKEDGDKPDAKPTAKHK